MIKYCFKDRPVTIKNAKDADPQAIGEALDEIAIAHGGHLRPKDVVQSARKRTHPLHRHFEWDDAAAAEAYRLDQARAIIRVIRIESEEPDETSPRAFLSVAEKGGVSYRTASDVAGSLELQLAVLKAAERDLDAFEQRYRELSDICDTVRDAREQLRERREQAEARAVQ